MRLLLIVLVMLISLTFNACERPECLSGDCINGHGIAQYSDGSNYEGQFKDGKRHGQGTWTFPNGGVIKGHFEKDKFIRP